MSVEIKKDFDQINHQDVLKQLKTDLENHIDKKWFDQIQTTLTESLNNDTNFKESLQQALQGLLNNPNVDESDKKILQQLSEKMNIKFSEEQKEIKGVEKISTEWEVVKADLENIELILSTINISAITPQYIQALKTIDLNTLGNLDDVTFDKLLGLMSDEEAQVLSTLPDQYNQYKDVIVKIIRDKRTRPIFMTLIDRHNTIQNHKKEVLYGSFDEKNLNDSLTPGYNNFLGLLNDNNKKYLLTTFTTNKEEYIKIIVDLSSNDKNISNLARKKVKAYLSLTQQSSGSDESVIDNLKDRKIKFHHGKIVLGKDNSTMDFSDENGNLLDFSDVINQDSEDWIKYLYKIDEKGEIDMNSSGLKEKLKNMSYNEQSLKELVQLRQELEGGDLKREGKSMTYKEAFAQISDFLKDMFGDLIGVLGLNNKPELNIWSEYRNTTKALIKDYKTLQQAGQLAGLPKLTDAELKKRVDTFPFAGEESKETQGVILHLPGGQKDFFNRILTPQEQMLCLFHDGGPKMFHEKYIHGENTREISYESYKTKWQTIESTRQPKQNNSIDLEVGSDTKNVIFNDTFITIDAISYPRKDGIITYYTKNEDGEYISSKITLEQGKVTVKDSNDPVSYDKDKKLSDPTMYSIWMQKKMEEIMSVIPKDKQQEQNVQGAMGKVQHDLQKLLSDGGALDENKVKNILSSLDNMSSVLSGDDDKLKFKTITTTIDFNEPEVESV